MSVEAEDDAIDDARIRRLAEELNRAIVRANERGLAVNLGISVISTKPSHALIRVMTVERPHDWDAAP